MINLEAHVHIIYIILYCPAHITTSEISTSQKGAGQATCIECHPTQIYFNGFYILVKGARYTLIIQGYDDESISTQISHLYCPENMITFEVRDVQTSYLQARKVQANPNAFNDIPPNFLFEGSLYFS